MTIYVVDEDGQVFVSPSDLNDFEYYRDNVFVRKFREFLIANPTRPILVGGWIQRLLNHYWESTSSYVQWNSNTQEWEISSTGTYRLLATGVWTNGFRPEFMRVEYTGALNFTLYDEGLNALIVNDTGSNSILRINWILGDGSDIYALDVGTSQSPIEIKKIEFGDYPAIVGPLAEGITSDLTSFAGVQIYAGDIFEDSSGYLHFCCNKDTTDFGYYTNRSGSWSGETIAVSNNTGRVGKICLIGSIVNIVYSDYVTGGIKHAYKNGSWTIANIDLAATGINYTQRYLDMYFDSDETMHIVYYSPDLDIIKYTYKTTSGSWATPVNIATSLTSCGGVTIVIIDGYVYVGYYVSPNVLKMITNASGSWVTTDIETVSNLYGSLRFFVNDISNIVCTYQWTHPDNVYSRPLRYLERVSGVWEYKNTVYPHAIEAPSGLSLYATSFNVSTGEAVAVGNVDYSWDSIEVPRMVIIGALSGSDSVLVYGDIDRVAPQTNRMPSPTNRHYFLIYNQDNLRTEFYQK